MLNWLAFWFGTCTTIFYQDICYVYVRLSNFRTFADFSIRTKSTFRQNTKNADTGSPAGHIGRGLGAIRAL